MANAAPNNDPEFTTAEQLFALKTWRYLRLALTGLAFALFAGIVEDLIRGHAEPEHGATVHCLQGSISAYYYTPVHGFLVGALVAIGTCLYCLRGDTPVEDALLNLAGMAAPVVAFVPTNPPGRCLSSAVWLDRPALASTSMFALVFLETIALLVLLLLVKGVLGPPPPRVSAPTRADVLGYQIAAGIVALEWVLWVLSLSHTVFSRPVHYGSAGLMFACFLLVVCARAAAEDQGHPIRWHLLHPNWEAKIAIGMVLSLVVFLVLKLAVDWDFAVLQIEVCLIVLFMAYWLVQTRKGWHPEVGVAEDMPRIVRHLSEPHP